MEQKKWTVEETKQFLEQFQDQYYVSEAYFWDLSGGRTRIIFDLKKTSGFDLTKKPRCAQTIQNLKELLEKFSEEKPDGNVSVSDSGLGATRIIFDMKALNNEKRSNDYKTHTMEEAKQYLGQTREYSIGSKWVDDHASEYVSLKIQLDTEKPWYLSIYFDSITGSLLKYYLDYEAASDSHYEFRDETSVRKAFYRVGDEDRYLDEIFIRYINENSGWRLLEAIKPYITAQFHYD